MKYIINSALALISLALLPSQSYSRDFKIPHRLQAGDVISADVINEVFDSLDTANITTDETALLGNWICDTYHSIGRINMDAGAPLPNWTVTGIYAKLSGSSVTFTDNGDGTYSVASPAPNAFAADRCSNNWDAGGALNATYEIHGGKFFYGYEVTAINCGFDIIVDRSLAFDMVSDTRFTLKERGADGLPNLMICDKQNVEPIHPGRLSVSASALTVSLSWSDNSDDETGFIILRKQPSAKNWEVIGQVGANIVTYDDALTSSGKYLYRIKAVNADGDSIGTNVVKVDVQ